MAKEQEQALCASMKARGPLCSLPKGCSTQETMNFAKLWADVLRAVPWSVTEAWMQGCATSSRWGEAVLLVLVATEKHLDKDQVCACFACLEHCYRDRRAANVDWFSGGDPCLSSLMCDAVLATWPLYKTCPTYVRLATCMLGRAFFVDLGVFARCPRTYAVVTDMLTSCKSWLTAGHILVARNALVAEPRGSRVWDDARAFLHILQEDDFENLTRLHVEFGATEAFSDFFWFLGLLEEKASAMCKDLEVKSGFLQVRIVCTLIQRVQCTPVMIHAAMEGVLGKYGKHYVRSIPQMLLRTMVHMCSPEDPGSCVPISCVHVHLHFRRILDEFGNAYTEDTLQKDFFVSPMDHVYNARLLTILNSSTKDEVSWNRRMDWMRALVPSLCVRPRQCYRSLAPVVDQQMVGCCWLNPHENETIIIDFVFFLFLFLF